MIGYLAANDGTISGHATDTADGIMRSSGRNTGNLAFWQATRLLFKEEVVFIPWKTKGQQLPKNLTALVIPAANFIGSHSNLAPITEIITDLDVPTMVVGLGAQSESENVLPVVNDSVRRFLTEASKRAPYLAVRGEYSAHVCRQFGVPNVKILGCPSVFLNGNPDLGKIVEDKMARLEPSNVAIHAACRKGNITNVEREFVRYVQLFQGSAYVVQRPPELVGAMLRESLKPPEMAYLGDMAQFLGMASIQELEKFLRTFGYVPTSIDSWRSYLRKFSCSINTRIHGTMVAFQAEIPALCVVHDTRTRELAAQTKLPSLEVARFIEGRYDIKRLFSSTNFSGAAFDSWRQKIAGEYLTLLTAMKLTPSARLFALAEGPARVTKVA